MDNWQWYGKSSNPWIFVHTMDNFPCYGQLSIAHTMENCPWYGQLSMTWIIAIQLSILWEMFILKSIAWTDYNYPLTICPFALRVVSDQNFDLSTKILIRLIHFLGHCIVNEHYILHMGWFYEVMSLYWFSESGEIWRPNGFSLVTLFSETSQYQRQKVVLA